MKKQTRLTALFLAGAMALSMTACGGNSGNGAGSAGTSAEGTPAGTGTTLTEPGTFPISTEPITLTVMTQQVPNIVDIASNEFTKWYEEYTGIHIEWQLVPQDSVETNLNLSLASGDYPDIYLSMGIKSAQEDQYGGAGKIFMPLNDYIDSCMPNFKAILAERPELKSDVSAMDGSIYCLPSVKEYTHTKYAQKMWVNTKWLDTLGLEKPTTTEDFYQMLKAFKEQDPNGNGIADEVPISGVIDTGGGWYGGIDGFLMNAFIYDSDPYDGLRRYVKDSKVDIPGNKEEYREGLRYLNKLYTEGLIDPGAFSNTNDQLKQLALNPDIEILGAAPSGHSAMFMDITTDHDRYMMFDAIAPLEGPNGVRQATFINDVAEFGEAAISTSCSNPEAAARWLDGFYDYAVQMRRYWGPEGTAWRVAEDGELGLGGEPALYKTLKPFDESAQNESWAWLGIEYTPADLQEGMSVVDADTDLYSAEGFEKRLLTVTEELYIPYQSKEYSNVPKALRYDEAAAEERNLLYMDLQKLVKEYRVYFITGEMSLDSDWDSYVKALDDLGLARFLELENEAYTNYLNKA